MKRFSFQVRAAGSTYPREALAGATTFLTMCYIVVVQPAMMEAAGMDPGAVFTATCLASALATFLMAFLANYPIALAPGMGNNAYFAYVVVLGMGISWEAALGAVFISGALFILLASVGFRERIMAAVPDSLKMATAAGIGLLIAFLGLQWGGLVASHPATLITLGDFTQPATYVALVGLGVTVVLHAWKVRGALVAGIGAATMLGLWQGVLTPPRGVFSAPPSLSPTLLALDPCGRALRERPRECSWARGERPAHRDLRPLHSGPLRNRRHTDRGERAGGPAQRRQAAAGPAGAALRCHRHCGRSAAGNVHGDFLYRERFRRGRGRSNRSHLVLHRFAVPGDALPAPAGDGGGPGLRSPPGWEGPSCTRRWPAHWFLWATSWRRTCRASRGRT